VYVTRLSLKQRYRREYAEILAELPQGRSWYRWDMASNSELLRAAILEKMHVKAEYDGYHREMCPHALGRKGGVRHVFSFQFAGQSSGGLRPGGEWRCMEVDKLSNVSVTKGQWRTRDDYKGPPPSCIDQIEVEVAY